MGQGRQGRFRGDHGMTWNAIITAGSVATLVAIFTNFLVYWLFIIFPGR
jgi:hypothetical protein